MGSVIKNNNASNNRDGIYLLFSSNNSLSNNNVSNNGDGIDLYFSSSNKIYLNNFINNTNNTFSYDSINLWNSTEKITYTYKGNQYTNYLGN
ncbi:MAG: NosD domain-containing protein, partial [Methanosarcinales archaeon]